MKRPLVQILVLAGVTGIVAVGYRTYRSWARPPEYTFRTARVDRGNILARVTATGTLSAHVTVQVGSQVSGRLQQINVDFNSPVKKGDVIAKIDPQIFEATLAQARANVLGARGDLTKARAQVVDAERKFARAKALRAESLMSQADYDTAEAAVDVAKAQVISSDGALAQAIAQENLARVNLAYTTIVSPIDGTVISRNVDVGQTVAASLQAPTLFTIAEDLRKMQVDTNITEGDVGKLVPGAKASFVVDAYPNDRFTATIRQIRNAPQTVQNVVTYDAVIEVENDELKLRPGMTANVTVTYDRRESVLRIPNAALRFRPPPGLALTDSVRGALSAGPASSADGREGRGPHGHRGSHDGGTGFADGGTRWQRSSSTEGANDMRTVWVLKGPKPIQVTIRTGLSDGTMTEVVSGDLSEDDAVVLEATGGGDSTTSGKPSSGGSSPPRMRL